MGIITPLALFLLASTNSHQCDTLDQAAEKALAEAIPLSIAYEYGGVLYEEDGCFRYTKPATSRDKFDLQIRVRYPHKARLVGVYHTHPTWDQNGWTFSDADVSFHRKTKLVSFLAVRGVEGIQRLGEDRPRIKKHHVRGLYEK